MKYQKPIIKLITLRFIERICNANNTIYLTHIGCTNQLISFQLDQFHREFLEGQIYANLVVQMDLSHFSYDTKDSMVIAKQVVKK